VIRPGLGVMEHPGFVVIKLAAGATMVMVRADQFRESFQRLLPLSILAQMAAAAASDALVLVVIHVSFSLSLSLSLSGQYKGLKAQSLYVTK